MGKGSYSMSVCQEPPFFKVGAPLSPLPSRFVATSTAGDSCARHSTSPGKRGVGGGNLALRIGQEGDGAVAGAVLLRRLAAAQEVRGMRDRRPPVIREALERREREPAEVLSGKRHQPAVAERIQQEFHLRRTQGEAEIDAGDARAHATGGERALDRDLPVEGSREPVFQVLRRGIQRKLLHVGPSPVGKASVQRRRVCPTMGHIST